MTLSPESAGRIETLFEIAERNGALISVQELLRFLPEGGTAKEVLEAIATDPILNSRFELKEGYLAPRNGVTAEGAIEREREGRVRARSNLSHALRFNSFLDPEGFSLVAVSGSTSYGSASLSRDLDLFCVAPSGRMWTALARALVAARVYNFLSRGSPQICISCVMDLSYAIAAFSKPQGSLFARDAIQTRVLKGLGTYSRLMSAASWISEYYPQAYTRNDFGPTADGAKTRESTFGRAFEKLLYSIVGRYLRFKANALNARLGAGKNFDDMFEALIGEDHLIYESSRYNSLRSSYHGALGKIGAVREG